MSDPLGAGDQQGTESTFTPIASQEDFDKRIQDRIARERSKFGDYEDLKAKAAEFEKFKEGAKSEQQKAIDAAKAEGATEVASRFTARIVNTEIKATAAALGFSDPTDAIALYGDISGISVDDNGADAETITTRLSDIAKAKPYLLKGDSGPKVWTRPKPKTGSTQEDSNKSSGKSRVAAALREFSGTR